MLNAKELKEAVAKAGDNGTVYVGDGSGLYVRIRDGHAHWGYSYRSRKNKKHTSRSLGPYRSMSLKAARISLIMYKGEMWGLHKDNITIHVGDDDLFSVNIDENSVCGLKVVTEQAMANLLESDTVPPLDEDTKDKIRAVRKVIRNDLAWVLALIKGPKVWGYIDE